MPAQIVAGGSKGLPVAAAGRQAEHLVLVDVPTVGAVRITYRLDNYKHRRSRFWHWKAVWAEAADPHVEAVTSITEAAAGPPPQ